MLYSSVLALLGAVAVSAAPVQPFINGTKLPDSSVKQAGGAPPNGPPPPTLSQTAIGAFQLANFLENLESNYFQTGLYNLTQWGAGAVGGVDNVAFVGKVAGQEEVHVATIEKLLSHFNATTLNSCRYQFPVTNTHDFFALANIITSVGIGAITDLASSLAGSDPLLIQSAASIITVEARHDSYFRMTAGEVPNPAPFDIRISGAWAYNLALPFVIPGSCGALPASMTSIPVFPPLSVVPAGPPPFAPNTPPTTITFSVDETKMPAGYASKPLFIGWVNQANTVIYTPVTVQGKGVLNSDVPQTLNGMAFAALTGQNIAPDVGTLTTQTMAGPAPVPFS